VSGPPTVSVNVSPSGSISTATSQCSAGERSSYVIPAVFGATAFLSFFIM
jgi:hypothetical protein